MRHRSWARDAARVVLLATACALHAIALLTVVDAWDDAEILRRDYIVFSEAGRRALAGEPLYDAPARGFPFLHPPPVAALAASIAGLEPRALYLALTASSLLALGLAIFALPRLAPRPGEHDLVALGVLASAPWSIALVLGQPLPWALALALLALLAWRRGRPRTAGLLVGLLLLKPTLALAPLAAALVRRERAVLQGVALTALALGVVSLPLGLDAWRDWLAALARTLGAVQDARLLLWKQHTWLAFCRALVPGRLAWAAWALVALPLGLLVLRRVRQGALTPLRAGGLLALAAIALGPYAYFYDALLLAIPAAALWLERERYSRRVHALLSLVAGLTFAWQHLGFFAFQRGPALGGLLATLWLALELAAHRGPRGVTPAAPPTA